jgi:fimbrial chaperone protein
MTPATRHHSYQAWAASVLMLLSVVPGRAASLQVSPVRVEVTAPGAATTLALRNNEASPVNAQLRVYRWTQRNGEERLEATEDVVASPPMVSLAPAADYTVRLVRVSKAPVTGVENYRLLVDELPRPAAQLGRTVNMLLRYSIPVFFYGADAAVSSLTWSVEQDGGQLLVSATNKGDRPVRVSDLKLHAASDTVALSQGNGLAGYVLGQSTMHWPTPSNALRLASGSVMVITAIGDTGPIRALSSVQSNR